ncbi:MAG: hypothetical protein UX99_C0011G0014 [Candidatus Amesbacteria bacterium GW2011_GWB1_47_26]|uniref:Twin-arginine translocation signal domain-containing protein n=1 Tax=Candidatus Amesbacteria bacterium GW2011_GWC2_45_19 TaxID=1618366 RepID=A0A0G1M194_9BACT|nr:MAG: hypothetical protein UX05_C0016G0013 [Candidatus Amesbacteria bacterium GW2011_GWC2_45_19]KKU37979.1 MAG: hypothetical protein UX52_C0013G0013 [Candidatus Amesbacteria bacterium GW2011_GWA1_46_35]KKU68596.1 MAG: hypothetical protein UX93_C0006G0013 [Microgenomates group bacterium GW2011_GWC1_47_20]KKU74558.1 MAG: hypothetical protein UX99_C0011G0014 [Candidatus Amesbacteria bacterium GW2011_GWB1_47_26]
MSEITRRDFIKLMGTAAGAVVLNSFGLAKAEGQSNKIETAEQLLSRKEHFKPFNRGNAEWQYVEFQYSNAGNERIGITTSISELTNPHTGEKTQQLLVMRHNLNTGETKKNVYDGTRTFDEATSKYTFIDGENNQLAEFSYDENGDKYLLKIKTGEFDSDEIDSSGLVLRPQGNLIPVSKDGNFTVASFEGGKVVTNYFADHVRVEKQNGDIVGYGRRDSENLELEGLPPTQLDIDHTWVHTSGLRADGKRFFITAWGSKTGGQFNFVDVLIVDPATGYQESFVQFNEEDTDFIINFTSSSAEQETPAGQSKKPEFQMAHGGKVITTAGNETLFELEVDGNPGQIIDSKGFLSMVEAHGRVIAGSVLGSAVTSSDSAIWETTDEKYSTFLPIIQK